MLQLPINQRVLLDYRNPGIPWAFWNLGHPSMHGLGMLNWSGNTFMAKQNSGIERERELTEDRWQLLGLEPEVKSFLRSRK